jgi:hypothetical protein
VGVDPPATHFDGLTWILRYIGSRESASTMPTNPATAAPPDHRRHTMMKRPACFASSTAPSAVMEHRGATRIGVAARGTGLVLLDLGLIEISARA